MNNLISTTLLILFLTESINCDSFENENVTECLIEGDILCPRTKSVYKAGHWVLFNSILDKSRLWPNRIVNLYVDPIFDFYEQAVISEAIDIIESKSCVRFKRLESKPVSNDRVDWINLQRLSGCYADLGRVGGEQKMSLASSCLDNGPYKAVHELMHALGFWHEHTRPDRDDYIQVVFGNIRPGYEQNFYKQKFYQTDLLGLVYDYR